MTMREILFRGKHSEKSRWDYGDLHIDHGKVYIGPRDITHGVCVYGEVIPETVGQFTGLTDKNGKKIFEGDVVAQNLYDYNEPIDDSFGVVVYCESNCSFSVMDANENRIVPLGSCHAYHWEAEVIGNIHDNPELMEGN